MVGQVAAYRSDNSLIASGHAHAASRKRTLGELSLRVISALLMIVISVAATVLSVFSFAMLVGLIACVLSWEWDRLTARTSDPFAAAHLVRCVTLVCALTFAVGDDWTLVLVSLLLGGALSGVAAAHRGARRSCAGPAPALFWSLVGTVVIALPVLSLLFLRASPEHGLAAVLFVFAIVWGADSAAFLFGRTIGGPRVFPTISPNKTWAGLIGGTLAGLWISVGAGEIMAAQGGSVVMCNLAIIGVVLAVATLGGDSGESALKLYFRCKDVSGLIPGHGGVLDRVDGLIVAACVAVAIGFVCNPSAPAAGLLQWTTR